MAQVYVECSWCGNIKGFNIRTGNCKTCNRGDFPEKWNEFVNGVEVVIGEDGVKFGVRNIAPHA